MTRFARAKGSKASNERLPEEATSWHEMKRDLLNKNKEISDKQNRETALKQRQANYQAFLQEKEEEQDRNISWAQFPEEGNQKTTTTKTPTGKTKANNHNSRQPNENMDSEDSDEEFAALKLQIDKVLANNNMETCNSDSDEPPEEASVKEKPKEIVVTKAKKPKKKLKIVLQEKEKSPKKKKETLTGTSKMKKQNNRLQDTKKELEVKSVGETETLTERQKKLIEKKIKRKQKQEAKKKLMKKALMNNDELDNSAKLMQQKKLKDTAKGLHLSTGKHEAGNNKQGESKPFQKFQNNQKQKKAKTKDDKKHNRRKPKPEQMFINGKTIEIDYVDGFPVKKEDADRLKKLRKEMISKGLPRSEINIALKLERRRAEKAFAREKKNVCFNCRKSGHNLSECPELEKDQVAQSGTGICFKCGSTEHTHFECKVVKGLDYKFATCFICKEQGHIAKQCPDNQRGLYPKGGSCKVCGDVTHLKKDCPKYQAQQSQLQNSLSIDTMDNGNPDDLGGKGNNKSFNGPVKRLNKVIKF